MNEMGKMNDILIIGFLISATVLICFLIIAYIIWLHGLKKIRKDLENIGIDIDELLGKLKEIENK